jgi:hypothetical protein
LFQVGGGNSKVLVMHEILFSKDNEDLVKIATQRKVALSEAIEKAEKIEPQDSCSEKKTVISGDFSVRLNFFDVMDTEMIRRVFTNHFDVSAPGVYEDSEFWSIFGSRVDQIAKAQALFW